MATQWSQYDGPTVKRNANVGPQRPSMAPPQPEMQTAQPRLSLRDRVGGLARDAGSLVAGEKAAAMNATAANQLSEMNGLKRFATNFITNAKITPLAESAAKGIGAYGLYQGGKALIDGDYDAAKSHFTDSAVAGASVLPQLNPVARAGATGYALGTGIHKMLPDNANDAIGSTINKGLNLFGAGHEDTGALERVQQAMAKTKPAAAPQPQAAPENVAGNGQPVVGGAFKTDGISPELQARMEKNGIKFDGAPDTPKTQERRAQTSGDMVGAERMKALGDVRVVGDTGVYSQQKPGQSPEFSNVSPFKDAGEMVNYAQATNKGMSGLRAYGGKGGTLSTIETGGAENYAKQLATIQGLRGGLGPQGGTVSVIANPDKKAPPSALEKVESLLGGMSGKLNASGLAAIVDAQKADETAAIQRESIAQRDRENVAQAAAKNTGPSFRDLLEAKKFQYQTGRDKLQDELALDANDRNNRVAGANLAATGQSIAKGREDLTAKQFESLFRKQDDKGNDIADTGSIGRFSAELAHAIETLANSGDKGDVARFGIQYKKDDGSLGLRARTWDELTDTDKNELVRGFKFSDHVKKYATDGDRGGNFGEYMRGRKDAQGRIVFGAGGKVRAIADEATLNSDGDTLNPLNLLNPFDKRSFGLNEKRGRTEGFVK